MELASLKTVYSKNPDVINVESLGEGHFHVDILGSANSQGPPCLLAMNGFQFAGSGPSLAGDFILYKSDGTAKTLQSIIGNNTHHFFLQLVLHKPTHNLIHKRI